MKVKRLFHIMAVLSPMILNVALSPHALAANTDGSERKCEKEGLTRVLTNGTWVCKPKAKLSKADKDVLKEFEDSESKAEDQGKEKVSKKDDSPKITADSESSTSSTQEDGGIEVIPTPLSTEGLSAKTIEDNPKEEGQGQVKSKVEQMHTDKKSDQEMIEDSISDSKEPLDAAGDTLDDSIASEIDQEGEGEETADEQSQESADLQARIDELEAELDEKNKQIAVSNKAYCEQQSQIDSLNEKFENYKDNLIGQITQAIQTALTPILMNQVAQQGPKIPNQVQQAQPAPNTNQNGLGLNRMSLLNLFGTGIFSDPNYQITITPLNKREPTSLYNPLELDRSTQINDDRYLQMRRQQNPGLKNLGDQELGLLGPLKS